MALHYTIKVEALKNRNSCRVGNKARNMFVYLVIAYGGYANKEITDILGNVACQDLPP